MGAISSKLVYYCGDYPVWLLGGDIRLNEYGTIVLGRHGESMAKEFLCGSVTNKILCHPFSFAIWIVQ